MPREIVPSIGGGRNWIFTPVFLRRDGVGVADGDGVAEGAGATDGDGVADGTGVAVGEGERTTIGSGEETGGRGRRGAGLLGDG